MKQYEKPRLVALSLSANDMLCSGCDLKTKDQNDFFVGILNGMFDQDGNGYVDSNEIGGLFASQEQCSEYNDNYGAYCKYTAADNNLIQIFTS